MSNRNKALLVCAAVLMLLVGSTSGWSAPVRDGDPLTIGAILAQEDGSTATVTAEQIINTGRSGKSFAIKEWFDKQTTPPRLIVTSRQQLSVHEGWTCDITGVLSTFSGVSKDGRAIRQRVLITSPENISIYLSPNRQRPILFLPIKGFGADWEYKTSLANLAVTSTGRNMSTMSEGELPPMPDGLNAGTTPIYCETMTEARAAYNATERILVELQCRPFSDATSTQFTLGQESPTDSITVWYTGSSSLSGRIHKIVGAIQKDAGSNYWLEVDSGPNWQSGYDIGSIQTISNGTIAWAKTFANSTTLPIEGRRKALESKVVTQVDRGLGCFYVQEPNRSSAIRVYSQEYVEIGDTVDIDGVINSVMDYILWMPTGERAIEATSVSVLPNKTTVNPLGMTQRALKCGALNAYTPGITEGVGPNVIGQLVKLWGKVTSTDTDPMTGSNIIYLDDGSALKDGSTNSSTSDENIGIRVLYTGYTLNPGDFCVVTGTLSTWTSDGTDVQPMLITEGPQSLIPPAPPAPTGLLSANGNANVYLSWNPAEVMGCNVYRAQGGGYSLLGSTGSTAYTDSTAQNGVTYTYYVTAKGTTGESGPSNVATATPAEIAPTLATNQFGVDGNGLLTVSYSTQAGIGGTTPTSVQIWVDGDFIWEMPLAEGTTFKYDTTQLLNGSHTLELRSFTYDAAQQANPYVGVVSQVFNTDNFIYDFQIPSIASADSPITANFKGMCNWTLSFEGTGHTVSGSGTSMSYNLNSSTIGDWSSYLVTLTATSSASGGMSTQSVYQAGGHIYTWYFNPLNTGTYAVTWVKDTVETVHEPWWQQSAQYTISKLRSNSRYGYMPNPDFRRQMRDAADALYMRNNVLMLPLEEMPPEVYAFYGHGGGGAGYGWPEQDGTASGRTGTLNPPTSFPTWYGYAAFYDTNQPHRKFYNVGRAIGNNIQYDISSPYPGRLRVAYLSRRLRFTQLSGCMTADSNFCLAFGTPRKRYPGNKSAFLGFAGLQYADTLDYFNTKFWNYLSQGKVVGMAAKWAAEDTLKDHGGNSHWRVDYRLYGDSRLRLWN